MSTADMVLLVFEVLGGLALFIFGMGVMTGGLRGFAGPQLRAVLRRATTNRFMGLMLGSLLGFLVHSSAGTVMLVGFVNAGLMTLSQSIAPVLGINIGTTLSMQVVSFQLDAYSYVAIAVGFLIQMLSPSARYKDLGRALLGFGLLFLGMRVMSGAIRPHREVLAPWLLRVDGSHWRGLLTGIALSAALTGIIQSSGATIGMCFALISAGVLTDLAQIYPIILGAHIGTCTTGLLGSIGANLEARRVALAHLVFNLFNVALAAVLAPWIMAWLPRLGGGLLRQAANLHTLAMVLGAVAVLPVTSAYARALRFLVRSRLPEPEPSFLERGLLGQPEAALAACLKELRRVLQLAIQSMRTDARLLFNVTRRDLRLIACNEDAIDDIKRAMRDYITTLARGYLSRRQMMLATLLDRSMSEAERIGDHLDDIGAISVKRARQGAGAYVDEASFRALFEAYRLAFVVLRRLVRALDAPAATKTDGTRDVLAARDRYMAHMQQLRQDFARRVAEHGVTPLAAIYYGEYLAALDRVVRHGKLIASMQLQPDFWIKTKKLEQYAPRPPVPPPIQMLPAAECLARLEQEDDKDLEDTTSGSPMHPNA